MNESGAIMKLEQGALCPLLVSSISTRYAEAGHRAVPLYRLLCRALVGQTSPEDWQNLTSDDWATLTKIAINEGVAGLVWHVSGRDGWRTRAPAIVVAAWRRTRLHDTAHNIMLLTELERVLVKLADAGIQALLLKGVALAVTVYEDPGLRSIGDLDLLIPDRQMQVACRAVEQLGYRPELSRLRRWLMSPLLYEHNYNGGERMPVHIELHWNLVFGSASRYRPDMTWFWRQYRLVQVGQQVAGVLIPGAELLHLAAHAAMKHGEGQALLRWYYDLHLLIERYAAEIDWDDILRQAAAWHWSIGLYAALLSTMERFNTAVPALVLKQLVKTCDTTDIRFITGRSGQRLFGRAAANWLAQGWRGRVGLIMMILVPRWGLVKHWFRRV